MHAVCDEKGRPLVLLLSEGQMSDHKGARLMLDVMPPAVNPIADKGYDSNWFRQALIERGIEPCIPSNRTRSSRYLTTAYVIASATGSRICFAYSTTGGASQQP
ncbi:transposase [Pseudochelatococcus contaminans]|uniref:transposase n=1 Tax=Pseudochelatococcus contaminans TaxID=1538103 RepID=UPI003D1638D0